MSLPANLDAERAVLGAVLLDNSVYYQAQSLLPQTFSLAAHSLIWGKMQDLQVSGSPIDIITLSESIGKDIENIGGIAYLDSLTDGVPARKNLESHVKIIRDKAHRRWLIEQSQDAIAQFSDDSHETIDGMALIESAALRVRDDAGVRDSHHISEVVPEVMAQLDQIRLMKGLIGFSTGIPGVDATTTGIRKDEYWVIGGRPSRGKGVLGTQIGAVNAQAGVKVLLFWFEMTRQQAVQRMIPNYSGVAAFKVRDPRYATRDEMAMIHDSGELIKGWPIWVVDPDGMKASDLVAAAKFHIHRYGVQLIVVDYLQIIHGPQREIRERVMSCSDALRSIPKSEKVPVVVLSQLARPRDGDDDKPPEMSQLRETGAIEDHAHTVLLLHRKREGAVWTGEDQVVIAKQRNGLVGRIDVQLHEERLWFVPRQRTA